VAHIDITHLLKNRLLI
jgi:hypothetical protein